MSQPTYSPIKSPLTPKIDFHAIPAQSHLFRPPPSSAASSLQSSTISLHATPLTASRSQKRKRARHDSRSSPSFSTPPSMSLANVNHRSAAERLSFQPLGQHRFELQSTMTPSHGFERCPERTGLHSGVGEESEEESDGALQEMPNSPNIRDGLGNVIHRFAGVAGKVWKNWSTSFRGFCAGGGQTYQLKDPILVENDHDRWEVIRRDKPLLNTENIPGGFPEDDYIANYLSQDHASVPMRAAKRLRPHRGTGEKWTVIDPPVERELRSPRPPRRKIAPPSHSAKRVARRQRGVVLPSSTGLSPSQPRLSPYRASFASIRTPTKSTPEATRGSPVSREVQQHAARIRRKEAEEEADLRRLNSQLRAMIKEGREALGTKFEIEDESNEENMAPIDD